MRTLVVSDLHLGARLEQDVLRRPAALDALLAALDGVDRLVLLGDTLELIEGRPRRAMTAAEPVVRAIGRRLGAGREVVVVPGNHDHALIRPWLRERRRTQRRLGLAASVPPDASPALHALTSWLAPARVAVRYPGVWLGDGIWATHGHYLDRHLVPEGSVGLSRRIVRRLPEGRIRAEDYERVAGMSPAAMQGVVAGHLPGAIGEPLDRAAGAVRHLAVAALPVAAAMPGRGALGPVAAGLLALQFRRASLPAMADVALRLDVRATDVVFGHVHHLGPRADDGRAMWRPRAGGPRLVNTGCWVDEPLLLAGSEPPQPYWPGGAVLLEDGARPVALGLLDGVPEADLRPGSAPRRFRRRRD